jgi:2-amino-4-hydroxy-6-hydroxymethyldihydropteridine diphosphokinase
MIISKKKAWIGIGANLGQPKMQVMKAIECLHDSEYVSVDEASSLYQTEPIGPQDQPNFINMVVRVTTKLRPLEMLHRILEIEHQFGRTRDGSRNGPRRLDLDLLMLSDTVIRSPQLTLPHPRLKERLFVLAPLMELEGDMEIPGLGCVSAFIKNCHGQGIIRLNHNAS